MLSPFNLLLITAGFSVVMLFVLASLLRSNIAGIREWTSGNLIAAVSLVLYAARGQIPNVLSIDLANALAGIAICMIYIGFRRFVNVSVPLRTLSISFTLFISLIVFFHYAHNSIEIRTVVVSFYFGAICCAIGLTILHAGDDTLSRYPAKFTGLVSLLFAFGHWIRGMVYWMGHDPLTSNIQASSWNLLFLSLGTLMLPLFTMGAIMMVHDRMMSKAIEDANRDFLTGAWSRRAFFEFADRELMRVRRTGRTLSLLVFDVDHFKVINDTHGHATGDRVLIELVQRADMEIRNIDYLARVGGEEFAVLLPEVDAAAAVMVAERLRLSLGKHSGRQPSTEGFRTVPYTVSIGVATHDGRESMAEFMHRADMALYEAKAGGRNIVVNAVSRTRTGQRKEAAAEASSVI